MLIGYFSKGQKRVFVVKGYVYNVKQKIGKSNENNLQTFCFQNSAFSRFQLWVKIRINIQLRIFFEINHKLLWQKRIIEDTSLPYTLIVFCPNSTERSSRTFTLKNQRFKIRACSGFPGNPGSRIEDRGSGKPGSTIGDLEKQDRRSGIWKNRIERKK